jgi:hypothetical protein
LGSILAIEGHWAGFCFFQFCDIENLVRISQKIAKLVKFTLEKQKNSQIFLSKKLQNLPEKTPLPLGRLSVFLRNFLFLSQSGDHPSEDEDKVMIIPEEHLGKSGYKPYMKYKT